MGIHKKCLSKEKQNIYIYINTMVEKTVDMTLQ